MTLEKKDAGLPEAQRSSAKNSTDSSIKNASSITSNEQLARQFDAMANLLTQQKAGFWRVNAYRYAAQTLLNPEESAQSIYKTDGIERTCTSVRYRQRYRLCNR